jgi:hypothetical protein
MKYISHRGNLKGPDLKNENHPDYIIAAHQQGFDVEIDVWYDNGKFLLGHDEPQHEVNIEFLFNKNFWCHAKNIDALLLMLQHDIHCFWHENDYATLTSRGYIWTYPGNNLTNKSICVMPESHGPEYYSSNPWNGSYAVCSDFIKEIRDEK